MKREICVHYLLHSGFAVEIGGTVLVFDYYQDEKKVIDSLLLQAKRMYFFSSHAHYDHFNEKIADFAAHAAQYFLSADIKSCGAAGRMPMDKTIYLHTYDQYQTNDIKVTTYDSTDIGTSFLVEIDGVNIFHAGDFNWWHWKGDSELNQKFARNGFQKQLKKMAGMRADIAFFPTDARLEEFAGMGAREFCRTCDVGYLVGMHAHGVSWQPAADFFEPGREIPTWCPTIPGQIRKILV